MPPSSTRSPYVPTAFLILAVLILTALLILPIGPAGAAGAADDPPGRTTWALAPGTEAGPDGRAAFDYVVEPGERYDDHVVVRNLGTRPLKVRLYAADAANTEDGSFTVLAEDEGSTGAGSWIRLARSSVRVPARGATVVPFRLDVPSEAPPGDHAAGILASVTTDSGDGPAVAVERRVGTRVYARVAGPIRPGLAITDLEASHESGWSPLDPGASTATFVVTNTGNLRLSLTAGVRAAGPFGLGSDTDRIDQLPELLPGSSVTLTSRLVDVLPLGRMSLRVTATPVASDGQSLGTLAAPVEAGTGYWAIQRGWLLLSLLVIALLAAAVTRAARRRRRASAPASASTTTDAGDHLVSMEGTS